MDDRARAFAILAVLRLGLNIPAHDSNDRIDNDQMNNIPEHIVRGTFDFLSILH